MDFTLAKKPLLTSVRRAVPEDACAIVRLFKCAYTTADSAPEDQYPYPQILDADWLRDSLRHGRFRWLVVEQNGKVVGCVAAIKNIGGAEDQIAEGFGLVVGADAIGNTLGNKLVRTLTDESTVAHKIFLSEVRTANPGAWNAIKKCDFTVIGFEPLVHHMPGGAESMLVAAKVSKAAINDRCTIPKITTKVRPLAQQVLAHFHLTTPAAVAYSPLPVDLDAYRNKPLGGRSRSTDSLAFRKSQAGFKICSQSRESEIAAGFVFLNRMEGSWNNARRHQNIFFSVSQNDEIIGTAKVLTDYIDARARIIDLRIHNDLLGYFLAFILTELTTTDAITSISVDAHTQAPRLLATLEILGFIPTVYYPAFVKINGQRHDAIQYMYFHKLNPQTHDFKLKKIRCDQADEIVCRIIENF